MVVLELAIATAFMATFLGVQTYFIKKKFFGRHQVEKSDSGLYNAPGGYYVRQY
jgi:hypothetical protein